MNDQGPMTNEQANDEARMTKEWATERRRERRARRHEGKEWATKRRRGGAGRWGVLGRCGWGGGRGRGGGWRAEGAGGGADRVDVEGAGWWGGREGPQRAGDDVEEDRQLCLLFADPTPLPRFIRWRSPTRSYLGGALTWGQARASRTRTIPTVDNQRPRLVAAPTIPSKSAKNVM